MPAPECNLYYYLLLDEIVMNGPEHVDIFYLDTGCRLGWLAYAKNKYKDDPVAFQRAVSLVVKVGVMHIMGHDAACQLENSALYYPGSARTGGEQMEPLWQKLSPLISTLRRCTTDRRKDIINLVLQQMNEEQEDGLLEMLMGKLTLALTRFASVEDAIKYLIRDSDSAVILETTEAVALTLLREWADELTAIQTGYGNVTTPLDWQDEWIIKRVQLSAVHLLGDGDSEATLRLLFLGGPGGSPLAGSVNKLRETVLALELQNRDALHDRKWDSPSMEVLRAAPGFASAFDKARDALVKTYERAAEQLSCAIASIDEILRRYRPNSTGIRFTGLRANRSKHVRSLTHQL